MKRVIASIIITIICCIGWTGIAYSETVVPKERTIPRTIIALYDKERLGDIVWSDAHRLAEMPLNHLGLRLEYVDINGPYPDLSKRPDVRGVLSWLDPGTKMDDPLKYIEWAKAAVTLGKRYVIIGDPGLSKDTDNDEISLDAANALFMLIGFKDMNQWEHMTYDVGIVKQNKELVGFERGLEAVKSPYERMRPVLDDVISHLVVRRKSDRSTDSHLIMISPRGAYIAEGYAVFQVNKSSKPEEDEEVRKWFINPMLFFAAAFGTDDLPKPDTTTQAGRRIYYSHIDGDGWNNYTYIERFRDPGMLSSEVILNEVVIPYPDLPVTVAPIAAEIDLEWMGIKQSQEIARRFFSLPHVEIASHTYTHPYDWKFFESGDPRVEIPYLSFYPTDVWNERHGLQEGLDKILGKKTSEENVKAIIASKKSKTKSKKSYSDRAHHLEKTYDIPRAYAMEPFDIKKEMEGSVAFINRLAPKGKKVELVQWSGDTTPFKEALDELKRMGIANINGGDSRFDREYPSYAWVSPIGRYIDGARQIYASNSNENTYTDLWRGRYHGFKYLISTLENTETPIRLKPINLYYHMYSGEREASLAALKQNLAYVRGKAIHPIPASRFSRIAEGFYTTEVIKIDNDEWVLKDRGALQTIRFDQALLKQVNFEVSKGVIGQNYFQGSLYVYLDEAVENPLIALKPLKEFDSYPPAKKPYLVESRYRVYDVQITNPHHWSFTTQGFGNGEMRWEIPTSGVYRVMEGNKTLLETTGKEGSINVTLPGSGILPRKISIELVRAL